MSRPIENLGEAKSGGVSTDLIANSREQAARAPTSPTAAPNSGVISDPDEGVNK